MGFQVAIDGPSGAGKSTISKSIAKQLGFIYVDTGALYRAIGLFAKENGIELSNIEKVDEILQNINLELKQEDGEQIVVLNQRDVSSLIRKPEISMYASAVSARSAVREYLLDLQRNITVENNVIMDGRDIGTVILPNANLKIFLTAKVSERAKRRYDELLQKGVNITYSEVLEDMEKRDLADSARSIAPAKKADDAIFLDTTGNTFEISLNIIKKMIEEKIAILA